MIHDASFYLDQKICGTRHLKSTAIPRDQSSLGEYAPNRKTEQMNSPRRRSPHAKQIPLGWGDRPNDDFRYHFRVRRAERSGAYRPGENHQIAGGENCPGEGAAREDPKRGD